MSNPNSPVKPAPKASSSAADPSVRQKIQAAKTALKDDLKDVNVSQAASAQAKLNDLADKNPNTPISRLMGRLPGTQARSYTTVASKVPSSQLDPRVPLSKFRNTLRAVQTADVAAKRAAQAAEKAVSESIEILDKEQISEMLTGGNEQNPPAVIVLRRRGIRIFPDGKRVALYDNKQLGLVFTVPYTGKGFTPSNIPNVTTEEVEHIEENLDALAKISTAGKPGKIKFKDGTSTDVHPQVAGIIHQLHGALNDENKKKVERMISHSAGQFDKIADFAVNKSEWKINK